MFRTTLRRLAASASSGARAASAAGPSVSRPVKETTGITGVDVHPDPLPALRQHYNNTLSLLSNMPESSIYRQAAEALTRHRLQVVEKAEGDWKKVEEELDAGQIEEVLLQAKDEEGLAAKMLDWKAWEPLEHQPAPGQWSYFDKAE